MKQITEKQFETLKHEIYLVLISLEDMGMGEMGECSDAAQQIVFDWCKKENIEIV